MPQAVETLTFEHRCLTCRRVMQVDLNTGRVTGSDPDYGDVESTVDAHQPRVGMGHADWDCPFCYVYQTVPVHTDLREDLEQLQASQDLDDAVPDPYDDVHPWYRPDGPWGPPPAEL